VTRGKETAKKVALGKERIVRAAVALADANGFESLSMRNLAEELLTAPMSLYRHFANKEELLDGMIDVVFREIYPPVIGGTWKTELRKRGISAREALRRHPWAIGLMETRMSPGPASAEHHNAMLGCLREAGFPFRDAVHAYTLLDAYTYGFALQEKTIPFETPEQSAEMAKATVGERGPEYPYLAEVVVEFATSGGYDYTEEFEFGLDFILDGLERLNKRTIRSGRRSRQDELVDGSPHA
jgi:AcrR family transcriptional regulator